MPEAPEVEAVARSLRPYVKDKLIRRVHVRHAIAVQPQSPATLKRKTQGARILGVERRGKYLLLPLNHGCLVLHFRFDGQLLWFDRPKDALARATHVDVTFETDAGTLAFVDPRHLGRVQWFEDAAASPGLRALGVDSFSSELTAARLAEICRASRRPLKLLLMDQSRIAGIGNIYSNEALWQARLKPDRIASKLTAQEIRQLHKAVVSVLNRALECCLHPAPDFRDPRWWFNGLETILRAYGREGEPCARCGSLIRRIEQGGRSSYFCPRCQR
jgi:formamidopyrimidine-DNA glycosylase